MYRLSIYSSPITFPLSFAVHTWVVLESPEFGVHRYEIHSFINKEGNYFYKNNQKPDDGMSIFSIFWFWYSKRKFRSRCIYTLEGDEYRDIILHLYQQIVEYPFRYIYSLYPGPNSNTFTQWIIEKAGLAQRAQLPWNAFGKKFDISKI